MVNSSVPGPAGDTQREAGSDDTRRVVVVGGGMVAQRFVEALRSRDTDGRYSVTVFAEEPRPPYDRVGLSRWFTDGPEALALGEPELWDDPLVTLYRDRRVTAIDRERKTVTDRLGRVHPYDHLVLATGSFPFVPPIPGADLPGVFVYRTIDDLAALRGWVEQKREASPNKPLRGAVIGGGLLGLEAAGALKALDAHATVIEFGTHLMGVQIDLGGGEALKRLINGKGIAVRTDTATKELKPHRRTGHVGRMEFADGGRLDTDIVVVATGVRPRDELAREAGLEMGERGGAVVDLACATSDPDVSAIGEVACIEGRCIGLVAPGYTMAEIVVDRLLGGDATFPGADTATKLKLSGVDVASFGDAHGRTDGCVEVVWADQVAGIYKKLVLSDDARTLLGGVFVGDAAPYAMLRPLLGAQLPEGDPSSFILPESGNGAALGGLELPDDATVCSCNNVSAGEIRAAVAGSDGVPGCTDVPGVKACTKAATTCGACLPVVKKLTNTELEKAGIEVSNALCEHFELTRAQLFDAVRVAGLHTFSEIIGRFGRAPEGAAGPGRGCDICKPVVASVLASQGNGHILAGEQAALQDTNDHMLANLQKDGTYSVVPRMPGGEVTPEGLIAVGEVARDFGLYTKITGGQRVDMFGARVEQLPDIWRRLVDAGFESGHAYGKSLRTVKSCVGSTWCRYGVQDSVGMAVELELRYRGLRAPHKLKMGVSGCARECAEAQSKDVGVIATDKGWNLYVAGNGGQRPAHAKLLAEDLTREDLITTIDRFLMYYIRTGDRLQRTAPWMDEVEGGLDGVRQVVMEDSLGICADLDAAMADHVASYEDEWRAVLEDPEKLRRFTSFVNAPEETDPNLAYVAERGQHRPATDAERAAAVAGAQDAPVLISGPHLEVRS
ncbi:nitrite reductase large subunit NirB [Myceligenerans salitolerans]|uniref:assimilatory sulfite reductase (ferredoxin) n=1 Tax=Myceligenerans salitolerans TaxID=1230528 RepID=A0ABS3I9H0_9MICO|nr:nitrite reductase large subunit NirB [Myceligenerans salitolerans]MBO0609608.1 nitrite reductase large subunit [Myceligenerans salitolerans]